MRGPDPPRTQATSRQSFNPRAPREGRATPFAQLLAAADDSAHFARTCKYISRLGSLQSGPPPALPG